MKFVIINYKKLSRIMENKNFPEMVIVDLSDYFPENRPIRHQ